MQQIIDLFKEKISTPKIKLKKKKRDKKPRDKTHTESDEGYQSGDSSFKSCSSQGEPDDEHYHSDRDKITGPEITDSSDEDD